MLYYTIPSDNRELQLSLSTLPSRLYYTIPSDNRELQLVIFAFDPMYYYTIPSDNRELQHSENDMESILIIPYQVITGNYNGTSSENRDYVLYHTK